MGPFPHDAPPPEISDENPMGTDGFEFVEYAIPNPEELDALFRTMGFPPVARHRSKDVTLYRQGDINFVLNAEPGLLRRDASPSEHGPSRAGDGVPRRRCQARLRARAVASAPSRRRPRSARWSSTFRRSRASAGLQIYFVDRYGAKGSIYDVDFEWTRRARPEARRASACTTSIT